MKRIATTGGAAWVFRFLPLIVLLLLIRTGNGQLGVIVYVIGILLWSVFSAYRREVVAKPSEGEVLPGEPFVRDGVIYRHVVSHDAE